MCSPASVILATIVTIIEVILKRYITIASKLKSIGTILASIVPTGEYIFQILTQYS